jgi:hypothetical protein
MCSDRPVVTGRLPPITAFNALTFDVAGHRLEALAVGCRIGAFQIAASWLRAKMTWINSQHIVARKVLRISSTLSFARYV